MLPKFCFRPALVPGSWRLEDEPKLAGGLETGFGVKFVMGLIIDGILKYVSKTVRTLVMRCPRKPWIIKRLPTKWSEDEKKKAHQALVAFMTSQRRPTRRPNRPPMPMQAGRGQ